ncbi:uncharacterized protein B0I36DRAFT_132793 [Microdochium trichocladiopsis]|uniref:Uncharacterized protein n=1 Tax=Microdochium trichocladiopsis TaxID=1682393 RepID=A0A9P9BT36_9PEZI|nr:uncharacterized protein B0I36DRAFT_132793 [Microdochium trichocladiopsis]KAH7029441.1 hypothetical protein B0I36DRAFT_132793 [Microdochium trichocladiopsis]
MTHERIGEGQDHSLSKAKAEIADWRCCGSGWAGWAGLGRYACGFDVASGSPGSAVLDGSECWPTGSRQVPTCLSLADEWRRDECPGRERVRVSSRSCVRCPRRKRPEMGRLAGAGRIERLQQVLAMRCAGPAKGAGFDGSGSEGSCRRGFHALVVGRRKRSSYGFIPFLLAAGGRFLFVCRGRRGRREASRQASIH